jgi:hypothetical protein
VELEKIRSQSAIIIQKNWRRWKARDLVSKLRQQKAEEMRKKAATKIQASKRKDSKSQKLIANSVDKSVP